MDKSRGPSKNVTDTPGSSNCIKKHHASVAHGVSPEMEGFEPSRVVKRLPHFECGPFSHLGTSPYKINAFVVTLGKNRG